MTKQGMPISRLIAIMARLRHPTDGCEWDREQNFKSIAPYTIEEAYEVADAIGRQDYDDLRGELGDLLLQVVFHSRMAEELGKFNFDDVADAICDKLESRHPHIFGTDESTDGQQQRWETLKELERAQRGEHSAMDGVASALPALLRADKLQKRASRVGFDWPGPEGAAEKLAEEINELAEAGPHEIFEEAGDLLFAAVNLVRLHGISAEEALRAGNMKFERRFRAMEELAHEDGAKFATLPLHDQENYWLAVKRSERAESP